jgi:hypothetical protein
VDSTCSATIDFSLSDKPVRKSHSVRHLALLTLANPRRTPLSPSRPTSGSLL